jgi:hypothetical protein
MKKKRTPGNMCCGPISMVGGNAKCQQYTSETKSPRAGSWESEKKTAKLSLIHGNLRFTNNRTK